MIDRVTAALRRSRADYTEIRVERTWSTAVTFRGRRLESATASEDQGGFVRVLSRGCGWGVASFTSLDRLERTRPTWLSTWMATCAASPWPRRSG